MQCLGRYIGSSKYEGYYQIYFNKVPRGLRTRKRWKTKKTTIIKNMPFSLARALCYSSLSRAAQTLPEHQQSFTATAGPPLQFAGPPAPSAAAADGNSSKARAAGLLHKALANSASALQEALQFLEEKAAELFWYCIWKYNKWATDKFSSQAAVTPPVEAETLHSFCSTFHTAVIMPT